MPARTALSEEAEQEEAKAREWLRGAEVKLRDLRERRAQLLTLVRALSDEQRRIFERRQPVRAELDGLLREHRALGQKLSELRHRRDELRARLEPAREALRSARARPGKEAHATPAQIRREMAELELRQQTMALSLADENALIDRIRRLRQGLGEAESAAALEEAQRKAAADMDASFRALREEFERLGADMAQARSERDAKMGEMRSRLEEDGRQLAEMRTKARARGEAMARLDALDRQVTELDREVRRVVGESRQRRLEARRTLQEYNRSVHETVSGDRALDRSAEAQLEELLKRGRVTLGG